MSRLSLCALTVSVMVLSGCQSVKNVWVADPKSYGSVQLNLQLPTKMKTQAVSDISNLSLTFYRPDGTTALATTISGNSGSYTINDVPSGNNYIIRIVGQNGSSVWQGEIYGYLKTLVGGVTAVATINKSTTPVGKVMHDLASGDSAGKAQAASIDPDALKTEIASDLSGKIPDTAAIANAIRSAATGTVPSNLTAHYMSNFEISASPAWQDGNSTAYSETNQEYLTVWHDYRRGGPGDLYAQRLSSTGRLIGDEIHITSEPAYYTYTSLAADAHGNYMLVYFGAAPGSFLDIHAQRLDSVGGNIGTRITICSENEAQIYPDIAYNSTNDEYLVVWGDGRANISGITNNTAALSYEAYGRRMSSTGALLASELLISTVIEGTYNYPTVAANTLGEYLVTWVVASQVSNLNTIYFQQLSSNLSLIGNNTRGTPTDLNAPNEHAGDLVAGPNGEFAWTWSLSGAGPRLQRVQSGALLGTEIDLSTGTAAQGWPTVTYNANSGEYLVAWHDYRNFGASGVDLYAQRVTSSWDLSGSELLLSSATSHQQVAVIANAGVQGFLVSWMDFRYESTSIADIYAQLISTAGVLTPARGQ